MPTPASSVKPFWMQLFLSGFHNPRCLNRKSIMVTLQSFFRLRVTNMHENPQLLFRNAVG